MACQSDEMTRRARLWLVEWEELWVDFTGALYLREVHEEHIVATEYNALMDFLVNRCAYWTMKAQADFEASLFQEESDPLLEKARQSGAAPGICKLGQITLLKQKYEVIVA